MSDVQGWYESPGDTAYPRFPNPEVLDVAIEDMVAVTTPKHIKWRWAR